jgi:hypothetical protein
MLGRICNRKEHVMKRMRLHRINNGNDNNVRMPMNQAKPPQPRGNGHLLALVLILALFALGTTGCGTTVYLPLHAKSLPKNQLAELDWNRHLSGQHFLTGIDGINLEDHRSGTAHLEPGNHAVHYRTQLVKSFSGSGMRGQTSEPDITSFTFNFQAGRSYWWNSHLGWLMDETTLSIRVGP